MRLPTGLPSLLVRSPGRRISVSPFPGRCGGVDNFMCTTTKMQKSGQCLALHGCGVGTIVAPQFFYGIRGTSLALRARRDKGRNSRLVSRVRHQVGIP